MAYLDIAILLENMEFKNIKLNSFESGNIITTGTSILLNGNKAIVNLISIIFLKTSIN